MKTRKIIYVLVSLVLLLCGIFIPLTWVVAVNKLLLLITVGFICGIVLGLSLEYGSLLSISTEKYFWDKKVLPGISLTWGSYIGLLIVFFGLGLFVKSLFLKEINAISCIIIAIGAGLISGIKWSLIWRKK